MRVKPVATEARCVFSHEGRSYAVGERVLLDPVQAAWYVYRGYVRLLPVGYVWPEAEAAFESALLTEIAEPVKRRRGRPRKSDLEASVYARKDMVASE